MLVPLYCGCLAIGLWLWPVAIGLSVVRPAEHATAVWPVRMFETKNEKRCEIPTRSTPDVSADYNVAKLICMQFFNSDVLQ